MLGFNWSIFIVRRCSWHISHVLKCYIFINSNARISCRAVLKDHFQGWFRDQAEYQCQKMISRFSLQHPSCIVLDALIALVWPFTVLCQTCFTHGLSVIVALEINTVCIYGRGIGELFCNLMWHVKMGTMFLCSDISECFVPWYSICGVIAPRKWETV